MKTMSGFASALFCAAAHSGKRRDRPAALSFRGRPKIPYRLHSSWRGHGGGQCRAWPSRRRLAVDGAEYRSEPDWRMVAPMTIATGVLRFSLTAVGCKVRAGLADWRSRFKLGVGSGTLPHCRRRYRDDREKLKTEICRNGCAATAGSQS
jgi:hypothetical protein